MHSDPISSALTKDNRKESKRNHRRERQDITTTSRCVVWAGLKLILLPCPPFLLLSRRTKGPACASGPHNRSGWIQILAEQGDQWGAVCETSGGGGTTGRPREPGRCSRRELGEFEGFRGQLNSGKADQDETVCRGALEGERKADEEGQKCRTRPRASQGSFPKAISDIFFESYI